MSGQDLEAMLRGFRTRFLSGTEFPSSDEEYVLAVGGNNGVYLLLPNEKKLIRIAERKVRASMDSSRKVCVHEDTLYDVVLGNIYNTIKDPKSSPNPWEKYIKQLESKEKKETADEKSIQREGIVAGLHSINGILLDFGAFAAGTKAYAVFDTLACPTGKELPIAIRDKEIKNLFEHNSVVYDLSDGRLFETFNCPTGKEKAVQVKDFVIECAYSYEGKLYIVGKQKGSKRMLCELDLSSYKYNFIAEVPISDDDAEIRFFENQDRLLLGIYLPDFLDSPTIQIFSTPEFRKLSDEYASVTYKSSALAAKTLGAVPVSKSLFQRLIAANLDEAKESMSEEAQSKIETMYSESEKEFQPETMGKRQAKRFFGELRKLRRAIVDEYAEFGLKAEEVQPGPVENKFKIYEQMGVR